MAALAFKAIDYGADRIPDRFFESIPGGFFTPEEKKKNKKKSKSNRDTRNKSEQRQSDSDRRRSRRDHTPTTDYSDYSGYDDTDYEREYRDKQRRRRAKSLGADTREDTGSSRGRHTQRPSEFGSTGNIYADMDHSQGVPQFPPPPTSEYRPYNPAEYAPQPAAPAAPPMGNEYPPRAEYGYSPQVNTTFRSRSATIATANPFTRAHTLPARVMNRSATAPLAHLFPIQSPTWGALAHRGSPLATSFSPSLEPPTAALLRTSSTNSPQPQGQQNTSTAQSSFAARYTPGPGYSPSPVNAPIPPTNPYPTYNPAEYAAAPPAGYRAPGNTYPSPPPFYRQESRSQPSIAPYHDNQLSTYHDPPSREDDVSSSRRHSHKHSDGHRHRAKSVGHHGRSRSRVTEKFRDRFDGLDERERGLAASVGGALAGGLAGNAVGKGTLSTLVGAAIGGLGGRQLEKRHEK
ncbi:hypothetical protein BU24DRAFT_146945 [Aaosphaeria arxii CBS 175.79]|uniref:Glycine zipper 2TM domain-containing protein n=1 Tax=Aaosphaeria arxii CBS 175.79 TaxID=1450172 RepID=A0A6A5XWN1_9PLEO|nr:uncharacterized protein BU24DRAFT_146945 [Aaosphaeria arxii CBS 175.79]KAF2017257.1 hypothetical protein BU24DRAFT_146945 [Aaosphaeria arxii CBS 175.79]